MYASNTVVGEGKLVHKGWSSHNNKKSAAGGSDGSGRERTGDGLIRLNIQFYSACVRPLGAPVCMGSP